MEGERINDTRVKAEKKSHERGIGREIEKEKGETGRKRK